MTTDENTTPDPKERTARIVALICFPVAVYLAFWQIDWGVHGDSLARYLLPVAFCIIIPSAIASVIARVCHPNV